MKLLFLKVLLFLSICSFAQNEVKKLNWSFSGCTSDGDTILANDRVVYHDVQKNRHTIEFQFTDLCCCSYSPQVQIYGDSLIVELNDTSISLCMCSCCYSVVFTFSSSSEINNYKLDGRAVFIEEAEYISSYKYEEPPWVEVPEEFEMLDGRRINYKNKYGFEEGEWINPPNTFWVQNYDSVWIFYEHGREKEFYAINTKKDLIYLREKNAEYIVYGGDTLNYIDSTGKRQGVHIDLYDIEHNRPIGEFSIYKDDIEKHSIIKAYDQEGNIWMERVIANGDCLYEAKFKNGKKVSECKCDFIPAKDGEEYGGYYEFGCVEY